jgi:hypothetical protein
MSANAVRRYTEAGDLAAAWRLPGAGHDIAAATDLVYAVFSAEAGGVTYAQAFRPDGVPRGGWRLQGAVRAIAATDAIVAVGPVTRDPVRDVTELMLYSPAGAPERSIAAPGELVALERGAGETLLVLSRYGPAGGGRWLVVRYDAAGEELDRWPWSAAYLPAARVTR